MEARTGAAIMHLLITTQYQPPQEKEKVMVVTETEKTYHLLMETTHPRLSFAQPPLLPPTPKLSV